MSGFIGGTINIVDHDCSRQSMSLYVLQPYKFDVDEHSSGSQVNRALMNMVVLLSMVLRHRGRSVLFGERWIIQGRGLWKVVVEVVRA